MIEFEESVQRGARIKVFGIGGGGCNAVDNMIRSNLKGVDFISTAGVGALLYAVGGARKNGGEIIFIEFSPKTKAVFEFLDLHDFIVTAPDLDQGVQAAKDIKSGARPRIS